MKLFPIGILIPPIFLVLGACSSGDSGIEGPPPRPSAAAGRILLEQDSDDGAGLKESENHPESQRVETSDFKSEPTGRENTEDGSVVEADREPLAKPIVPAFPSRNLHEQRGGMKTVFFGFDNDALSPETKRTLDTNIAIIRENPDMKVRVGGHTDERGTSEYNLGLGMRRAGSVGNYLISQGIGINRLITVTYGEEMPLKRGHEETSHRLNRRVDFSMVQVTAQR